MVGRGTCNREVRETSRKDASVVEMVLSFKILFTQPHTSQYLKYWCCKGAIQEEGCCKGAIQEDGCCKGAIQEEGCCKGATQEEGCCKGATLCTLLRYIIVTCPMTNFKKMFRIIQLGDLAWDSWFVYL